MNTLPRLSLAAAIAVTVTSCATTNDGPSGADFLASPGANMVAVAGGSLLVSEAVKREPELAAIALAMADSIDGIPVDMMAFDEPMTAMGAQLVGDLVSHYAADSRVLSPAMISRMLRDGVAMASAGTK